MRFLGVIAVVMVGAVLLPPPYAVAQSQGSPTVPRSVPPSQGPPTLPRGTPPTLPRGTPPTLPRGTPPTQGSPSLPQGFPNRPPPRPPVEVPETDFVWTWGEPSQDAEESAKREAEEGMLVVHVEG